jgi:LAO/AO transport system kinase
VRELRACDLEVGVLAVDPTSPFSGGAILGDRVRMQDHAIDPGVFIRSMATRGHLGGLALATPQAVRVLDAAGKQWIIIETVGVGQVEVEIAGHADSTVVVVNPRWGDAVQAAKAGLLEIADLFVVNKADRPGADETVRDLEGMLELSGDLAWRPPVVRTVATDGTGVGEVRDALQTHREFLETNGLVVQRRKERVRDELRAIVAEQLREQAAVIGSGARFEALVEKVAARELDPFAAAAELLD